ncbi:MAG: hypothetical protein MRZ94_03835 [Oscillospiraceae bacterium]|nr:hypothetical protein [Oscillospiraceae bacterium]
MHKKGKWLFVILLCLILFFTAAVIRFYSRRTNAPAEQEKTPYADTQTKESCSIFQDETTGLYGLADADDRVIAAAEWKKLYFIGDNGVAAVKQIGSELVTGVLDQEGNVIVPFVYQDLSYVNEEIIVGWLLHEDLYFLYDRSFHDLTPCAWNAYILKDSLLTLQRGTDTFVYQQTEDGIALCSFDLQRSIQRRTVMMHCEQQTTAQLFSVEEWSLLGDTLSTFLKAYQRNDEEDASVFLSADAKAQLQQLLEKDAAEKWLADWQDSIEITSQTDILGTTVYCAVTVERETESAVLQVAFQMSTAAGTLQITGLQIQQETQKTEASTDMTDSADTVGIVID